MKQRPIVLCFVAYYLPGYQSGGPVRTISNLVDSLGDQLDIRIVTHDRDVLDTKPYPNILPDAWNSVGNAQVFYGSARTMNLRGIAKLIRRTPYDVLYLNSFFSFTFTFLPLLLRWLGLVEQNPCVIAPRGEFSKGALVFKAAKKRLYIKCVLALGLYHDLHWQASSDYEKEDIIREVGWIGPCIKVVPNLPPLIAHDFNLPLTREPGPFRLVFLSRISEKKNLDFVLRALEKVSSDVQLSIYGPIREPNYWNKCLDSIRLVPSNVRVRYCGEVQPVNVRAIFGMHDLFVFPTLGENFGHVILESLISGTPVLVSDQTPWLNSSDGAITVLPLDCADCWRQAIENLASLTSDEHMNYKNAAIRYAKVYLRDSVSLDLNRELFMQAVHKDNCGR